MIDRYLRELIEGGASPDVISKMLGKIGYKESEVTTLIQKYGKGVRAPEINIGQKESAKIASEYLYKHTMEANQATKSINLPSQQRDAMGHLARAQAVFENANVVIPQLPMGQINKLRTNDPLFNQIAKQVNSLTGYNLPSSTIAYNSRGIEQLSRELQKMRGLKPKFASGGSTSDPRLPVDIMNDPKMYKAFKDMMTTPKLKGWANVGANVNIGSAGFSANTIAALKKKFTFNRDPLGLATRAGRRLPSQSSKIPSLNFIPQRSSHQYGIKDWLKSRKSDIINVATGAAGTTGLAGIAGYISSMAMSGFVPPFAQGGSVFTGSLRGVGSTSSFEGALSRVNLTALEDASKYAHMEGVANMVKRLALANYGSDTPIRAYLYNKGIRNPESVAKLLEVAHQHRLQGASDYTRYFATGGGVNYRHFQMNKPLKGWDRKIANNILDSRETIFGDQPGTFRMLAALDDLNDQVKGKDYYGSIVGYGNNYEPYGALSYADEGKNLWLSNLGVREPYQGKGIASNLFNSYSEHAKTSGYEGIRWQSLGIPETIEFYKKRAKLIDPRTLTFGKRFAIGGGVNPWTRKMDMFQAGHSSIRVSPHEALTTSWNPDLDKLNKAGRDGSVSPNELSGINLRNIASKIKGMFNGSLSDSKKDNITVDSKQMGVGGVLNGASTEFLQSNGASIKKFASGGDVPSFALGSDEFSIDNLKRKITSPDISHIVEMLVRDDIKRTVDKLNPGSSRLSFNKMFGRNISGETVNTAAPRTSYALPTNESLMNKSDLSRYLIKTFGERQLQKIESNKSPLDIANNLSTAITKQFKSGVVSPSQLANMKIGNKLEEALRQREPGYLQDPHKYTDFLVQRLKPMMVDAFTKGKIPSRYGDALPQVMGRLPGQMINPSVMENALDLTSADKSFKKAIRKLNTNVVQPNFENLLGNLEDTIDTYTRKLVDKSNYIYGEMAPPTIGKSQGVASRYTSKLPVAGVDYGLYDKPPAMYGLSKILEPVNMKMSGFISAFNDALPLYEEENKARRNSKDKIEREIKERALLTNAIEGVNKVYGKHATLVDKDRGTFNYQAYGSKEYEKLKSESQRSPLALAFKNALFEWSSRTNFMKTVNTTRYTGAGQLEVGGMSKALLTMLSESEGKLDRNNVPMALREEFDRYQKNAAYLNTGLKDSITGVLKDQLGGILAKGDIEKMVKVGTTRISQPPRGEFYEETQQSTKQLVEFDVEIDQVTEKLGKLGKSSEFIANTLNSVTSRIRKIPGLENFEMRAQTGQTQVESKFGERQRLGEKAKELSWKMASLSMSSMGVYFSMLGLFTTLQGVVTSLAGSLSDLNKTFQGIGYVNAFSRGMANAKTIMDAFGVSQKDLVSGWKSVMYIQGAVGLMFSSLASKMFNNKEFVNKLTQALTEFFSELSKTNTLEILENLMINMAKAAPSVIWVLKVMGGALDIITKNQTLATAAITAFLLSLVIQPISAFASASLMLVGSFIQIGAYAPAAAVGVNTLSKSFFTGTMAIVGYTAVVVALLEVGSRLIDMFTGWNTAFARPTTYLNAAFGGGLKDPFTGAKAFANGGEVTGANTSDVDDKVVRVDEGEYVINKKSAKKLGKSKLDQLNRYATGGSIGFLPDVTPTGMDFSKLQQTMVNTSNDNMYYMRKQNEAIDVSARYNQETKDVLQGSAGGSRPLYVFDLSNKGISGGASNAPIELTGDINPINMVNVPRNYGVNVPETQVNLPDVLKSTLSEIGNNLNKNLNDAVNNILKNNETLNNNLNNILESIKNNEALNNILEAIKNNEVVKGISDAVNNLLGKFTTNQNVVNPAGTTGINFNEVTKGLTTKGSEISGSVSNFFSGIKSSLIEEAKKYGVTTPLKGETGLTGAARLKSYVTSPATSEAALGLERTSFPYRAITGEKYKGGASRYTWDWREQLYPDAMPSKFGTGALIDYRSVARDAMRSNNNPGETAVSLLNAVAGNVITGRVATEASNIAMKGQSTILGKVAGAGVTGFTGAMRGISAVSDFMMPAEAGLAAADYRKGLTTEQIRNKMYLTNIGTGGLANEAYGRGVNYIQTSMGTAEFNKNLALQRADKSKGDYYTKLVDTGNQTQIDAEIKALGEKRFKETYDKIDSYMSGLKPLIGEAATNAITDTLTGTGYALPGAGEYLASTAKGAYTALTTDPGKAITDASTSVGTALMDTATSIGSAILNPLTSIFGGFNTNMAASASVIPKTTDTLNNNLNTAGTSIGNYATIVEQGEGTTKVALDQYGNILDAGGQSTGKSLDAYNNVIDVNTGEIDKNLVVLSTTFADGNTALQKATDSVSQSLADAATKWSFVSTETITNQPSFITGVNKQEADLNNLTFGSPDITDAITTGNEQVTNSLGTVGSQIDTSSQQSVSTLSEIGQKLDNSTEQSITGLTGISDKVETTNTIVPESLNAGFTATTESINSGTSATVDQTSVLNNILVTLQLIANYLQSMKLTVNVNGAPQTNLNSFTNDLTYQY